jgi:peptidoglycan/xylan/chitin deacetylase (PgdA/CDA1 family)
MAALVRRYALTRTRAKRRVSRLVDAMVAAGFPLTFPTPGRVVESEPAFFRGLQDRGMELALHGYDHVDFRELSAAEAKSQLARAAEAYTRNGIEFRGFRGPYLSLTNTVLELLAEEGVRYSSNAAIWWDVPSLEGVAERSPVFATLQDLYRAEPAEMMVSTPRAKGSVVEIPTSLPDDILLHDGLRLGAERCGEVWVEMLRETHRRGELFTLLFHPELDFVREALEALVAEARSLAPSVWVARLRDIDVWWREKAGFSADVAGGAIRFRCSDRATILVRAAGGDASSIRPWSDSYRVLAARELPLQDGTLPFLGIAPDTPRETHDFLAEQGYILDTAEGGSRCHLVVDAALVERTGTEVALLDHLDSATEPLVRFARWPDEAHSALCASGDLDALSLVDYGLRFVRFSRHAA